MKSLILFFRKTSHALRNFSNAIARGLVAVLLIESFFLPGRVPLAHADADTIPPTVTITNPPNGSVFSSGMFLVTTQVSDNVGVTQVEFLNTTGGHIWTDTQ